MEELNNKETLYQQEETAEQKEAGTAEEVPVDEKERLSGELQSINNKYKRMYAEFENYKKRVQKDGEELVKYANEKIICDLLPVIDNLEMAIEHSKDEATGGIVEGVENTLKELLRILKKFGLVPIETTDKPFDPSVHHALSVVEREDIEENKVVEVFRKGYMFNNKVIRAPLVSVSKKPVDVKEEGKEINIIEEES